MSSYYRGPRTCPDCDQQWIAETGRKEGTAHAVARCKPCLAARTAKREAPSTAPLIPVGEWRLDALCAETDPEAFFPEEGVGPQEAQRICRGCIVKVECLAYALEANETEGVWGGVSARMRRTMRYNARTA